MKLFEKISKFGMPLVIAISVILGMFIQRNINYRQNHYNQVGKLSSSKLDAILNYIDQEYVDTVNSQKIEESAISKVLEELDPHSVYISAADYEEMNEPLEGNFEGIGVQFNITKDTVVVIKTILGGPSEKVGIKDGDRIVTVNDSLIAGNGITNDKVMSLLRGEKGTPVKVGLFRRGESNLVQITIIRDKIPLYSVDVAYMVDKSTGYIKVSKFGKTTYKEFQDAVAKLKAQGMKKMVLDLRGNSGGYMDAATNIADEFLQNGKLIVYTQGRARPKASIFASHRESCVDLDLAVLIDEWSASASEIVSGAIQDNDRGIIVGRRSFGKGLVQEPIMFTDGSSMRLTIARYYTPSGRCIQKPYEKGQENYYEDINERFDNGEFLVEDSIHLNDSLKYYTVSGRVVYGGGGIMPDVFVPVDTTGGSGYYSAIARKGLEYQFCFEFTDKNRQKLTSFKNNRELNEYLENQNLLDNFTAYAAKNGVKYNAKGVALSGNIIRVQLKALIARNIFDNDGFYPIILQEDNTFLKALELLEKK